MVGTVKVTRLPGCAFALHYGVVGEERKQQSILNDRTLDAGSSCAELSDGELWQIAARFSHAVSMGNWSRIPPDAEERGA